MIICDDFLLQDSLLQFLCFCTSFILLYLFLPTYLCNCKKCLFLCNEILGNCFEDMKYFEDSQDVVKLPLTWTHRLKLIIAIRLMRKPCRQFFHCWKGQHKNVLYTIKLGARDAWWMQWELFEPLQNRRCLQLRKQGKSVHFCLTSVKEEKLKQVGVKSCFLTKLNTIRRKLMQVQWIFNACGGGCTFSVITSWCNCTFSLPLKALFDHRCQHTCLAKVQARTTTFSQDLQF